MERRLFLTALASSVALAGAPALAAASAPLSEEFLEAVRAGDLAKVRAMVRRDASLAYARDTQGRSAFVLAHLHRHAGVAAFLGAQGLVFDAVEAVLARDWDRVDEIGGAAPGQFDLPHPMGGTTMHAAALVGIGRDIWRIQQYGPDPNANPQGDAGTTAARLAVEHPDPVLALETTANLLGNGARVDEPQRDASSILHGAAATGDVALIRFVVRKGGNPEARDAQGRTPEDVARALGHEAAADALARHAEIPRDHRTSRFAWRRDGSAYRPADLSGYDRFLVSGTVGRAHFDVEATTEAMDRFPDLVDAISFQDEGAVEAAAHTGQRPVVELLLERGAPYSLPTATTMGDAAWARRLLREDPERVRERGAHDFALMWYPAIGGGQVELADLYLSYGADVDQEHMGTTGLHFAARGGQEELVAFLLERGADPDALGRKFATSGETPLDLATAREAPRVVEILEAAGATRRVATAG